MLTIHNQQHPCTRQQWNRPNTTGMSLGLVRLLLDAGRTKEARTVLASLQNGPEPSRKSRMPTCKLGNNS